MWRQLQVEAGAHNRGADRIVAAPGTQRRDRTLIVAPREAEGVLRQFRMMQLGLGDEGHGTALRNGTTLSSPTLLAIAPEMKRAVIGVPSKWSTRDSLVGSISSSLI